MTSIVGIFNQRIARGVTIMTSKEVLLRGMDLVRMVMIARLFTVEDFGRYSLVLGTITILSFFVMPQFTSVVQRFHPEYRRNNSKEASDFVFTAVICTVINAFVVGLIAYAVFDWIADDYYQKPELVAYLRMAVALIFLQPINDILSSLIMSLEKFKLLFWTDLGQSITGLLGILVLKIMHWETVSALLLTVMIATGLKTFICFWQMRRYIRIGRWGFRRSIIEFWKPLALSNFFKSITGDLPTVILGRLLQVEALGLYQIAEKSLKMIFSLLDPYINTVTVVTLNAYQESKEQFAKLLQQHFKLAGIAFLTLSMACILGAGPVFHLLYGENYAEGVPIFIILSFYPVFGGLLFYQRIVYSVTDETKQYLYFVIISTLVQIPIWWELTKIYGLYGAAIAAIFSRIAAHIIAKFLTSKILKNIVSYQSMIIPLLLAYLLDALLFRFYHLPQTWIEGILVGGLYLVIWGTALWATGQLNFLKNDSSTIRGSPINFL